MGKMPDALRETIARNIRDCRLRKFPGRGGGKRCAEQFGVSPQQWSPWESGKRTPDELRLEQIANFFGTTVEWFRRDHRNEFGVSGAMDAQAKGQIIHSQPLGADFSRNRPIGINDTGEEDNNDMNHFLWAIDVLTRKLTSDGIRIVVTFEKTAAVLPGA